MKPTYCTVRSQCLRYRVFLNLEPRMPDDTHERKQYKHMLYRSVPSISAIGMNTARCKIKSPLQIYTQNFPKIWTISNNLCQIRVVRLGDYRCPDTFRFTEKSNCRKIGPIVFLISFLKRQRIDRSRFSARFFRVFLAAKPLQWVFKGYGHLLALPRGLFNSNLCAIARWQSTPVYGSTNLCVLCVTKKAMLCAMDTSSASFVVCVSFCFIT